LLPQVLSPGTQLEVTLHTPPGPLDVIGTIVWADPRGSHTAGKLMKHGLRYTTLPWSTALALARFLADRG
jgi:hypothetical protein